MKTSSRTMSGELCFKKLFWIPAIILSARMTKPSWLRLFDRVIQRSYHQIPSYPLIPHPNRGPRKVERILGFNVCLTKQKKLVTHLVTQKIIHTSSKLKLNVLNHTRCIFNILLDTSLHLSQPVILMALNL